MESSIYQDYLVTSYYNPDLDGVASAVTYAELLQKQGKKVVAGVVGSINDETQYILNRFGIESPIQIDNTEYYTYIVLVDTSDIGSLEGKIDPQKVVEIIDHRQVHEVHQFPQAKVQIEMVGAAVTLVVERFIEQSVLMSRESALLAYGAVLSNTLNLRGSVTTERDKKVIDWLQEIVSLPYDFWRDLFLAKSDLSGSQLEEKIRGDFSSLSFNNQKVGIAQLEILGVTDLLNSRCDEIVNILKSIQGEQNLDYIFQNTIDLEAMDNIFITHDVSTQELLAKVLPIQFNGVVAKNSELLMRKQIVPLLKAELGG